MPIYIIDIWLRLNPIYISLIYIYTLPFQQYDHIADIASLVQLNIPTSLCCPTIPATCPNKYYMAKPFPSTSWNIQKWQQNWHLYLSLKFLLIGSIQICLKKWLISANVNVYCTSLMSFTFFYRITDMNWSFDYILIYWDALVIYHSYKCGWFCTFFCRLLLK